jgi:hypothetical protein
MSPSTKSKPESASSLETGDAPETADKSADKSTPSGPIEIELEGTRQRTMTATAFYVVIGALLLWKLGTVGVWVGVVLLVVGAFRAWELAQTFMHPPGTIVVTDDKVTLPRGLYLGKPVEIPPAAVTSVYFLRRSVPWNRSAPVLVVEVGARAMAFPRDWFASEADQRHVVHALLRYLPAVPGAATGEAATSDAPRERVMIGDGGRTSAIAMAIGFLMTAAGVTGLVLSHGGAAANGSRYALLVGPIVAGLIFLWRGFAQR